MMKKLLSIELEKTVLKDIYKDLSRTIETPIAAQKALFAVNKCLANHFPDVGYV